MEDFNIASALAHGVTAAPFSRLYGHTRREEAGASAERNPDVGKAALDRSAKRQ
jgi:hypothetical protein